MGGKRYRKKHIIMIYEASFLSGKQDDDINIVVKKQQHRERKKKTFTTANS